MKKASVLFFAAALACALVLSGCTARRNDHDGNVNDTVTDSPLVSIMPTDNIRDDDDRHDNDRDMDLFPDVSIDVDTDLPGAVTPDVTDDPLASPSTNPSGSAAPSATESP